MRFENYQDDSDPKNFIEKKKQVIKDFDSKFVRQFTMNER